MVRSTLSRFWAWGAPSAAKRVFVDSGLPFSGESTWLAIQGILNNLKETSAFQRPTNLTAASVLSSGNGKYAPQSSEGRKMNHKYTKIQVAQEDDLLEL